MSFRTLDPLARKSDAFTLVELVTVLGILSVLMGIGGAVFFGQRAEAKKDRARADLQVIQIGLEAYRARFGGYPNLPAPNAYPAGISNDAEYLLNALCGQIGPTHDIITGVPPMLNCSLLTFSSTALPYSKIESNEIVDPWNKAYKYDDKPLNSSGDLLFGYDLRSAGPDGAYNTEDDMIAK